MTIFGTFIPVWLLIVIVVAIFAIFGKRIKDAVWLLALLLVLWWIISTFVL